MSSFLDISKQVMTALLSQYDMNGGHSTLAIDYMIRLSDQLYSRAIPELVKEIATELGLKKTEQ